MGPTLVVSDQTHADKYRGEGETFRDSTNRVCNGMSSNDKHFYTLKEIIGGMGFLPAGRIQSAVGSLRKVTPGNCYVGVKIEDSMDGIMRAAHECAMTLRQGGGWGSDFSTIRPKKDLIASLGSDASGPVSFMGIMHSTCETIKSAGHRRGAMMGVLRCDHPDILDFIRCKTPTPASLPLWAHVEQMEDSLERRQLWAALQTTLRLTNFNISVGVTDEFMNAVVDDGEFDLKFGGRVYARVRARDLWDEIMRSTWDWAEPGILFIDRINEMNNLWYCETLEATNPCGEQPLPEYGVCMLGSWNLVKYIVIRQGRRVFDMDSFRSDIAPVVEGMDNIFDAAVYPLPQQKVEQMNKRRMGIGVTGVANALEALGLPYGSDGFCEVFESILAALRDEAYIASSNLAKERGSFPLFDRDKYSESKFVLTLPSEIQNRIYDHGIRNSHLLSIAPTGTISLTADNISSGIEPVFEFEYDRAMYMPDGTLQTFHMQDYGLARFGVRGRTTEECTVDDHLRILAIAQKHCDSACSKTINVGSNVTFSQFQDVYLQAWKMGAKGCTTFRKDGKRLGILVAKPKPQIVAQPVPDHLVATDSGVAVPGGYTPSHVSEPYVDGNGELNGLPIVPPVEPSACYFDGNGQKQCE